MGKAFRSRVMMTQVVCYQGSLVGVGLLPRNVPRGTLSEEEREKAKRRPLRAVTFAWSLPSLVPFAGPSVWRLTGHGHSQVTKVWYPVLSINGKQFVAPAESPKPPPFADKVGGGYAPGCPKGLTSPPAVPVRIQLSQIRNDQTVSFSGGSAACHGAGHGAVAGCGGSGTQLSLFA